MVFMAVTYNLPPQFMFWLFGQRTNSCVFRFFPVFFSPFFPIYFLICKNLLMRRQNSSRARFRAATQKQVSRSSRAQGLLSQNHSLVLEFYCSQHELGNYSHI